MSKTKIIPIAFFLIVFLFVISFFNPYLTVRRNLLLINPVKAVTGKIYPHYRSDSQLGHCYYVNNFWKKWGHLSDNHFGVCVKKTSIFYYATSHGSY